MRHKLFIPFIALALLFMPACGTLDKSGPYQGDKVLYDADLMIASSYDAIHSFVTWEYQNRAALAQYPHIQIKADELRKEAPGAFRAAIMLRDTYAATPNDGTKTALSQSITILRGMTTIALSYMSQYSAKTLTSANNPLMPSK